MVIRVQPFEKDGRPGEPSEPPLDPLLASQVHCEVGSSRCHPGGDFTSHCSLLKRGQEHVNSIQVFEAL